ncbi:Tfp pilus assembly protein PilV [Legionella wadsworthii]|uniref:Tfp pilus assembly protein PilV n=1 Tax=Legionella wadsworthii TaxID=28088 RepID=A0A378LV10_9GAMM|nr:prepilin-type N-terminal cleavage/methylation domain-containing protein [Legionella wadsworthii]STY29672.1 Tfp pilus assembly protein PilV [Legionella wadsworthii]
MMKQKGFSLTEVLVSLLLVTTLTLGLLQQQRQSEQILKQLIIKTQGLLILNQIEETLIAGARKIPQVSSTYHLKVQNQNNELIIQLAWNQQIGSITRNHQRVGSLL